MRRLANGELPICTSMELNELDFDARFVLFDCSIRHDCRFHHSLREENARERRDCYNLRVIEAQGGPVDFYLHSAAREVFLLTD